MNVITETTLTLPPWVGEFVQAVDASPLSDPMGFVLQLAEANIQKGDGGPFAAAIVDESSHLISVGMNLVVPEKNPTLHGEMVALILGSKKAHSFDLSHYALYSSAEPCAMCAGAIHWAGLSEIYFAATADDVSEIAGFDEGPVHPDWHGWNQEKGRTVRHLVEYQSRAVDILAQYRSKGGTLYNA